jgi:CheY-like chemotaxis protein
MLPSDRPAEPKHPSRVREIISAKVLLVDDEETVLQLEHEVLRARGVTVKLARSGKEAVELLRRETVDAVVTDMKMVGEISALTMYQWIEQNRPELSDRVVFTASSGRDGEASTLLRKSGCPVVSKPFAIEQLWEAVQKVLTAEVSSPFRRGS